MPRSLEGGIEQQGPENKPTPARLRITRAEGYAIKHINDSVLLMEGVADSLPVLDDIRRQGWRFLEISTFAVSHLEGRSQAMCSVSAVLSVARKVAVSKTICISLLVGELESYSWSRSECCFATHIIP